MVVAVQEGCARGTCWHHSVPGPNCNQNGNGAWPRHPKIHRSDTCGRDECGTGILGPVPGYLDLGTEQPHHGVIPLTSNPLSPTQHRICTHGIGEAINDLAILSTLPSPLHHFVAALG